MKSKITAIVLSSLTAIAVLFAIDAVGCFLRECIEDDASIRAGTLMDLSMLVVYFAMCWIVVFPLMLILRRRVGIKIAVIGVSITTSVAVAGLIHSPEIDGVFLDTVKYIVPWLSLSWLAGGIVTFAFWPDTKFGTGVKCCSI